MNRAIAIALLCGIWCVGEISALGSIYPKETIYREVNDSFSLQCTLDMQSSDLRGMNSSHMMFYIAYKPVPREQVKILNDSTIELTVEHAETQATAYVCMVNGTIGVSIRSVLIGHKPREVKDFKCRAPLWDKHMVCTFTPDPNTIHTSYELHFHFQSTQMFRCALETDNNTNQTQCIIETRVHRQYRLVEEHYSFVLTASNVLGMLNQSFEVNHFNVVIPKEPQNCVIEDITSDSAVLKWEKWYRYRTFHREFICEVKLMSSFDNNVWRIVSNNGLMLNISQYTLPLRHLPFAAANYDVRIRMRVNSTEVDDDLWSNYTSCLFKTLPRKPDMPPDVAIGGFDTNGNRLYVYWRELQDWQHNARHGFYYNITMVKTNGSYIYSTHFNATRGMIDWHVEEDHAKEDHGEEDHVKKGRVKEDDENKMNYTFRIQSSNGEGISDRASVVLVPHKTYRPAKPVIDKLLSDSGKFTFSWNPSKSSSVTSYSVFWCNTTSNSPNDCDGSINFTTVARDKTTFVLSDAGAMVNFAVAANSGNVSSGMVWAACKATHKTQIGWLKEVKIYDVEKSTDVNLTWTTDCFDVAHTGYVIYYCPIAMPRTPVCNESELAVNVTEKTEHNYIFKNLKPYVTYRFEVAMYSKTHIGPRYPPLIHTTREAAPSPPRNLTYHKITNNSVTLHWLPPEHINSGKISYEILYNGHSIKHNVEEPKTEVERTLDNLEAFTVYEVTVRALTIDYSNTSESVRFRTLVGTPQAIGQPSSNSSDDSKLTISWNPPSKLAGCVEFYELKMKTKDTVIYQQDKTECQLREAICQNRDSSKYEFFVRAVNVEFIGASESNLEQLCSERWTKIQELWPTLKRYIASTECGTDDALGLRSNRFSGFHVPPRGIQLHYGPWSEPLAHWCSMENKNTILPFMASIMIMIMLCLVSYSWFKVRKVVQVKVIIPDGLNDITGSGKPGFNTVIGPGGIIYTDHRINSFIPGSSTKEEGYIKEQNQCLLPSSSSAGGSIADLSGHDQRSSADYCSNSGCCEEDSTSFYDQEAERQDLHGFSDDTTEPIEGTHTDDAHLDSRGRSSPNSVEASLGNMNQGYHSQPGSPTFMTAMDNGGNQSRSSALPITVTSGYIPAPLINPVKQSINANGYLQIGALSNGGMMASMDPIHKTLNTKMAAAPISGYVTHKQLSDYGQQLK